MGTRKKRVGTRGRGRAAQRRPAASGEVYEVTGSLLGEIVAHPETSPQLTGGDLDADWLQAHLSGEEAVGGSVATPDQDIVDEIGRALGVEQEPDAEVRSLEELVQARDRNRWRLEEAAEEAWAPSRRGKRGAR